MLLAWLPRLDLEYRAEDDGVDDELAAEVSGGRPMEGGM